MLLHRLLVGREETQQQVGKLEQLRIGIRGDRLRRLPRQLLHQTPIIQGQGQLEGLGLVPPEAVSAGEKQLAAGAQRLRQPTDPLELHEMGAQGRRRRQLTLQIRQRLGAGSRRRGRLPAHEQQPQEQTQPHDGIPNFCSRIGGDASRISPLGMATATWMVYPLLVRAPLATSKNS